jgi:hypothetical protein
MRYDMESNKSKSSYGNNIVKGYSNPRSDTSSRYMVVSFLSLFLLLSFFSMPLSFSHSTIAAVDIDTSGDGKAAAYDGEESIATDGDSFCSVTDDIAAGKFSSLFEGIVDCDDSSQIPNQFLVEYLYTKDPVKIGELTYLTVTVKDKNTGSPISNAFVTLTIEPQTSSFEVGTIGTAAAAAAATTTTTPAQEAEKATQVMHTDKNGHTTFTVQIGPKSDVGIYDTELEVNKDSYQSSFEQTNLYVIPQLENVQTPLRSNNEGVTGGDGGDGGDAVANGGTAIGGDGGAGGAAVGGNAIGGDGGDGGDAIAVAQDKAICDGTAIGGAGGYGGDATKGIQGTDGENGSDEMVIC